MSRVNLFGFTTPNSGENRKHRSLQNNKRKVETSLKTDFAQISLAAPKHSSCPKFGGEGGAAATLPPPSPGPYAYENVE